ncbi:hypothetical protein D1872_54620 [compost metagenome]
MAKKETNNAPTQDELVVIDRSPKGEPYTLSQSIYDGATEIKELFFNFETLTVDHLLSVDKQMVEIVGAVEAQMIVLKATSLPYQLLIASLVTNTPYPVLKKVSAKDALAIGSKVMRFLTE